RESLRGPVNLDPTTLHVLEVVIALLLPEHVVAVGLVRRNEGTPAGRLHHDRRVVRGGVRPPVGRVSLLGGALEVRVAELEEIAGLYSAAVAELPRLDGADQGTPDVVGVGPRGRKAFGVSGLDGLLQQDGALPVANLLAEVAAAEGQD